MGNFLTSPVTTKETETGALPNGRLAFGVSAMQGWRTNMEDTHITQLAPDRFPPNTSLFAVFDGHGGRLAAVVSSELLAEVMIDTFKKNNYFESYTPTPEEVGKVMVECFLMIDEELRSYPEIKNGSDQSGCTALAAFVTPKYIVVANAGDSRSVLGKAAATVPMSFDHKPMNENERRRIESAGGMVRGNRVNGDLAVSRAIGDFTYKNHPDLPAQQQQVSAEPDITIEHLDGTEEFLILACDGIWDVMSNDGVCEYVRKLMLEGETNLGLIAEEILDHCLDEGSRDNMSAIVVKFPGAKFGSGDGVAAIRRVRQAKEKEAEARGESSEDRYR